MATIRDVAKIAGTSVSAVSAVLSGNERHNIRVGQATRERILQAAAQLHYTPNPVARSLVTRKTGVVGLAFPYSSAFIDRNPFCGQVMSGVLEEVIREKYNVMLHTAIGEEWHTVNERSLLDPRVDGLILVLPPQDSCLVTVCHQRSFPCVALVHKPESEEVCAVNADEFTGGRLATEHLLERGHRRIAHLAGEPTIATTEPRKQGYQEALRAAGASFDPTLLVQAGFNGNSGYEGMRQLLALPVSQRPTAVFAANDLCAEGALNALREAGLRAPEDMAVVGYDDTWFANMTQPTLTSVHMPIYEMSVLAAQMLIALVEGREIADKQPILPVSLTVRESS